jgi:pimeloyl-ACP methyl ester carboxylesterase
LSYHLLSRFYSKDPSWPKMMDRDVSQTTVESFFSSISSLRRTDLCPLLHQIKIPVMGMYGATDIVVQYNQWKALQDGVPHAEIEKYKKAGHFIMLDEPDAFMLKLKDFLDQEKTAA